MIEQNKQNKLENENGEIGTPYYCAFILLLSNSISCIYGVIKKYDSILDIISTYIYIALESIVPLILLTGIFVIMYHLLSYILNNNLKNIGIEIKKDSECYFIPWFDILSGIIILAVSNFVVKKILGVSIFYIFPALNIE